MGNAGMRMTIARQIPFGSGWISFSRRNAPNQYRPQMPTVDKRKILGTFHFRTSAGTANIARNVKIRQKLDSDAIAESAASGLSDRMRSARKTAPRAEMDAGTGTSDFGAAHTERCIHMFRQCARHGAEKTRPARAAVELGVAAE